MYKEGKVYMPKDKKLRAEIIRLHHDMPIGEHGGQWKMVELVTRNFWWPGVTKEVKRYVEGCDACQHNKNCTEQLAEKLIPNSIPEKPWTHISVDFITKLPLAQEYNSILVVADRLTKMVHFISTTEKTLVEGLARLLRDKMWKLHGLPESIVSDRRPQFMAEIMKELNKILEINVKDGIPKEQRYGMIGRNYTPFRSNILCRRGMYLAIVERMLWRRGKDVRAENDLLNDLGFNLCVVPQSPVVKLVAYFGVKEVVKTEVLRGRVKELEWTRQG